MTLSSEELLKILELLAGIAGGVPECGFVVPAPLYFSGIEDFRAKLDPQTTQKDVETREVALTTLTMSQLPEKPVEDGDAWTFHFNFHIFRRYEEKKVDESDAFLKKLLKSYALFLKACLDLITEFSGETKLDDISERITECYAEYDDQTDTIAERERGRYIQSELGFAANVPVKVSIVFEEC